MTFWKTPASAILTAVVNLQSSRKRGQEDAHPPGHGKDALVARQRPGDDALAYLYQTCMRMRREMASGKGVCKHRQNMLMLVNTHVMKA